jgi:hypothetical protein
MKWLLTTILAAFASGCCCGGPGQQAVDPFYGRVAVQPPPTGSVAPPPGNPYYQAAPPGNSAPLQQAPQGPSNPPYPSTGNPATLQPIPQGASNPISNPGTSGNWTNPRPGTSTSWTSDARGTPGDVVTIPVSEGSAAPGPAVGPAADEPPATVADQRPVTRTLQPRPKDSSRVNDGSYDVMDLPPAQAGGS